MKKFGWQRQAGQTPREFAAEVEQELQPVLEASELVSLPGEIVAGYYSERYGADSPGEERLAGWSQMLKSLEGELRRLQKENRRGTEVTEKE